MSPQDVLTGIPARFCQRNLIAEHGVDFPGPALREILPGDCPKRNASLYERCSVYFPNVPTVF